MKERTIIKSQILHALVYVGCRKIWHERKWYLLTLATNVYIRAFLSKYELAFIERTNFQCKCENSFLQGIRFLGEKMDIDFSKSSLFWYLETKKRDSNLVDSASSIRLSQRLSHACLSINDFILWNCEWLIISVIVYLMVLATWITVVILELIHASSPDFWKGCIY